MDYVIGCDIGSQGVKVTLVDVEGCMVGEAISGYAIDYPKPTWAEQSAEIWIRAIEQAIEELLALTRVDKDNIRAIGLDAQVDGVVPIDKTGSPLYPAIIWMDRRAIVQIENAKKVCDPESVFNITGLNFDAYHVAPKIRWFAENHPELNERTKYFLLPGSFVALYLTGEIGVDYSNASSTLLMDVRTRQWDPQLCECFGVPLDSLSPIYPANIVLGKLRSEVADKLGLSRQTQVILGCGDEHAASLGAGVVESGLVCDIAGTAEPVCAATSQPIFDSIGLVETHCHADPDLWLIENPGFVSGGNIRWFRDHFTIDQVEMAKEMGVDIYELLNTSAERIPAGSEGLIFLPCLMGAVTPTWNAHARGTFMGFTLTHKRDHFVRAIMEGSAYALRDITDRMVEIDLPLREVRAVGGGARSSLWRQIKADVTGLPVTVLQTVETTSLGAAILALHGAGLVSSLNEGVDLIVKPMETRYPDPQTQSIYEDYYQLYRQVYFNLLPVFETAAEISQ